MIFLPDRQEVSVCVSVCVPVDGGVTAGWMCSSDTSLLPPAQANVPAWRRSGLCYWAAAAPGPRRRRRGLKATLDLLGWEVGSSQQGGPVCLLTSLPPALGQSGQRSSGRSKTRFWGPASASVPGKKDLRRSLAHLSGSAFLSESPAPGTAPPSGQRWRSAETRLCWTAVVPSKGTPARLWR